MFLKNVQYLLSKYAVLYLESEFVLKNFIKPSFIFNNLDIWPHSKFFQRGVCVCKSLKTIKSIIRRSQSILDNWYIIFSTELHFNFIILHDVNLQSSNRNWICSHHWLRIFGELWCWPRSLYWRERRLMQPLIVHPEFFVPEVITQSPNPSCVNKKYKDYICES